MVFRWTAGFKPFGGGEVWETREAQRKEPKTGTVSFQPYFIIIDDIL